MTKEQKIRALTELRNNIWEPKWEKYSEVIIDLKETESRKGKVGKGIILESFIGKNESYTGYDSTKDRISVYLDSGTFRPKIGIKKNNIKLLGQPLSITDILRMIDKRDDYLIAFSTDGLLQYLGDGKRKDILPIYFNLSKGDLIKNQDEKVIDELIKLFNLE